MATNNTEKPLSIERAYALDQMANDADFQAFQSGLGDYATTPEYQASLRKNPDAWLKLSKVPGAAKTLTGSPNSWQAATKNPQQSANKLTQASSKFTKGNEPVAQIVVPDAILPPDRMTPEEIGLEGSFDVGPITEQLDRSQLDLETAIGQLEQSNAPLLRGEIPQDVQDQLRRKSSETMQQSGISGQKAEARTARDFGLTSLQVKEMGMQTQAGIIDARKAQASILQARREYEKNYQLQTRQFMEDIRRTDISTLELDQKRRMFNAEQNINLVKLVADLASTRAQIRAQYDTADVEGADNTLSGLNNVIGQIDKIIGRIPKVT